MIRESFNKNKRGIGLMVMSSCCVCVGQLFWKLSAGGNLAFLSVGFVLYAIGAVTMVTAYRFGNLSTLQPLLSISYVLSILIGYFVLSEQLTSVNLCGVLAIIAGVILIAGGD